MDKDVAKLIDNYGQDIFPYLRLRAAFSLGKQLPDLGEGELESLETSGFISRNGSNVILCKDDRWLYQPPEVKQRISKDKWVNPKIEELASIIGYPDDWQHKQGKYLKMYSVAVKKYSHEVIMEVAQYLKKEDDDEVTLTRLLTDSWFRKYKHDSETKESYQYKEKEYELEDW